MLFSDALRTFNLYALFNDALNTFYFYALFNDALNTFYLECLDVKRRREGRRKGRKEVFYLMMHSTHFIFMLYLTMHSTYFIWKSQVV